MTIEIKDNEVINKLADAKLQLASLGASMAVDFNIDIRPHREKIDKLIDNAIKKERVKILESEIEKIKKGAQ